MEKAKVAVFEDNEQWQNYAKKYLEASGHTVVALGRNIGEAEAILDDIFANQIEIDCIVCDGTFFIYDVMKRMKNLQLTTPVIGYSSNPMSDYDAEDFVAYDLGKQKAFLLGQVVSEL